MLETFIDFGAYKTRLGVFNSNSNSKDYFTEKKTNSKTSLENINFQILEKKIKELIHLTEKKINFHIKTNGYLKNHKKKSLLIIVGNSFDYQNANTGKYDVYYVNKISKEMNFKFLNRYKKILIIEPYFGNVLERRIKKKVKKKIYISTVSYEETIIHKYGSKIEQDKYLKFDNKNILKKINEFF